MKKFLFVFLCILGIGQYNTDCSAARIMRPVQMLSPGKDLAFNPNGYMQTNSCIPEKETSDNEAYLYIGNTNNGDAYESNKSECQKDLIICIIGQSFVNDDDAGVKQNACWRSEPDWLNDDWDFEKQLTPKKQQPKTDPDYSTELVFVLKKQQTSYILGFLDKNKQLLPAKSAIFGKGSVLNQDDIILQYVCKKDNIYYVPCSDNTCKDDCGSTTTPDDNGGNNNGGGGGGDDNNDGNDDSTPTSQNLPPMPQRPNPKGSEFDNDATEYLRKLKPYIK